MFCRDIYMQQNEIKMKFNVFYAYNSLYFLNAKYICLQK